MTFVSWGNTYAASHLTVNVLNNYSADFYRMHGLGTQRSADRIVPVVMRLFAPTSVVDVGCGTGLWLARFGQSGVTDILGIDGNWVEPAQLAIARERFVVANLSQPLHIDRRFDLAMCLEVGEHLPDSAARVLVQSLVSLAPVIVFSAAIPFQGGTDHVNEQWPEYWESLFREFGYHAVDCVRHAVWSDPQVEFWYAQNLIVYVANETSAKYDALKAEHSLQGLALVHPTNYIRQAHALDVQRGLPDLTDVSLSWVARSLPAMVRRALQKRLRRAFSGPSVPN